MRVTAGSAPPPSTDDTRALLSPSGARASRRPLVDRDPDPAAKDVPAPEEVRVFDAVTTRVPAAVVAIVVVIVAARLGVLTMTMMMHLDFVPGGRNVAVAVDCATGERQSENQHQ